MPLRSFVNYELVMGRHRKELHGALDHDLFGLCVNLSLLAGVRPSARPRGLSEQGCYDVNVLSQPCCDLFIEDVSAKWTMMNTKNDGKLAYWG